MANTVVAMANFEKIINKNSIKAKKQELEEILQNINNVCESAPAVFNEKTIKRFLQKRAEILDGLAQNYLSASISQHYPLLHKDLFTLKRRIILGKNRKVLQDSCNYGKEDAPLPKGEKISFNLPLFVYVTIDSENEGKNYKTLLSLKEEIKKEKMEQPAFKQTASRKIKVEARLPGGIGQDLKEVRREAVSYYFQVFTDALRKKNLGEFLLNKLEKYVQIPEIAAMWIPAAESLRITVSEIAKEIKPDPIMLMKVLGNNYLVKAWRVDNELPYEGYIREFSFGRLNNKL